MTDIQIRPEVVSLLLDVDDMTEFAKGRLTHIDGRPFTADEFQLAGSANAAEMRACADCSERVSAMYEERHQDTQRAMQIMEPYFDRLGPEGTVSDVRKICTPAEDAELEAIFERTCPDGYIYLTGDPLRTNDPACCGTTHSDCMALGEAWCCPNCKHF